MESSHACLLLQASNLGHPDWWQQIKETGTPFIRQSSAVCYVDFFWQDPQGTEGESETVQVLLEVNSVTNHHSWTPRSLTRISGTDVWHGVLELHPQWSGCYVFIPLTKDQTPEYARKNSDGSEQAQRRWYLSVMNQAQADPLNLNPGMVGSRDLDCSALHMPEAERIAAWQQWDEGELPVFNKSESLSFVWHSDLLDNERDICCFSTASENQQQPLIILLDGQRWSHDSGMPSVLANLTAKGDLPGATYLLISSVDAAVRWAELSCSAAFWQAVLTELIPYLKSDGTLNFNEHDMTVAGQSLGGLSALYAGLNWPEHVKKIVSLSGSFWWPNRYHKQLSASQRKRIFPGSLTDLIARGVFFPDHLSAYLAVGDYEPEMIDYNDLMVSWLVKAGSAVIYEKFCGGHDWLPWRSSLVKGLVAVHQPGSIDKCYGSLILKNRT